MSARKKILLFSTDSFLAYQPSILNLYDALAKHFEVSIITHSYYNRFVPVSDHYKVTYLRVPMLAKKILFGWDMIMKKAAAPVIRLFSKDYTYQNELFKNYLIARSVRYLRSIALPDEVIAVDFVALAAAQKVFSSVILQSLEIYPGDKYKARCNFTALKAIIIPSQERYEYHFGDAPYRKFITPNAPTYKEYVRRPTSQREGFIWAGTIDYKFGVQYVARFIRAYPEYRLTLKGAFVQGAENRIREEFADLLGEGRLIINTEYLENDAFITFISQFTIGFCFYDWDVIRANINYWLAPAGRLFMYYSAGVPTIACNTPGLKSITTFGAGIQIDDYEPVTIKTAADRIIADYEQYAAASIEAAKAHSFEESCTPLIDFLNAQTSTS